MSKMELVSCDTFVVCGDQTSTGEIIFGKNSDRQVLNSGIYHVQKKTLYVSELFTNFERQLGQGKNPKLWVSSYFHIWMMGYFRVGQVRVNECPAGSGNWPRRCQKYEKATVKIRRNTSLRILSLIHFLYIFD